MLICNNVDIEMTDLPALMNNWSVAWCGSSSIGQPQSLEVKVMQKCHGKSGQKVWLK